MPMIDKEHITTAQATLQRYARGKQALDKRVIENDRWYRLRHWDVVGTKNPAPASAWLFNALANKHGDAMDNTPEPVVLPREASDDKDAKALSQILPVIAEYNDFEHVWSESIWDKIKNGTAVYFVPWDSGAENGLGDISIKRSNLLNLFWEPGVEDIQDSPQFFALSMVDNAALDRAYPDRKPRSGGHTLNSYQTDDQVDEQDKSEVVDWYYKTQNADGRQILHYCKYCGETILYSSENDPELVNTGFYDHGKYPFVFDPLFPIEESPCGFGYLDIMKSPQLYIDMLDKYILENARFASKPRWFVRDAAGINQGEFANWDNDFVHVTGRITDEDIRQIEVQQIPAFVQSHMLAKIDELKETSGNRDFSQGGTSSGVTAAAAIAALQEAGNKLSRDMLKGSYRAYRHIMELCIELIRQFYTVEREFRITQPNGTTEFVQYSNANIVPQEMQPAFPEQAMMDGYRKAYRKPIFDVRVKAQKSNPYSQLSQNETAKELYQLGAFLPQNSDQALAMLDMMEFEGKQQVVQTVQQNGTLYSQVQQMQALMQKMAAVVYQQTGQDLMALVQGVAAGTESGQPGEGGGRTIGKAAQNAMTEAVTPYAQRVQERARASVSD